MTNHIPPASVPPDTWRIQDTLRNLRLERARLQLAVADHEEELSDAQRQLAEQGQWLEEHGLPFLHTLATHPLPPAAQRRLVSLLEALR